MIKKNPKPREVWLFTVVSPAVIIEAGNGPFCTIATSHYEKGRYELQHGLVRKDWLVCKLGKITQEEFKQLVERLCLKTQ
jgi:hypothetical protein